MTARARVTSNDAVVAEALRNMRPELRSFVAGRVPMTEVDEVLQLAAMRAVEGAPNLEQPGRVRAWLFRIHRNVIIDTYRKRSSEQTHIDFDSELPDRPSTFDSDSCYCSISQAQRLRPSYATILSLVDAEGMAVSEAARRLDVSENNAAVRLHRARNALKHAMREHCGVESLRDCAACRCIDNDCCLV